MRFYNGYAFIERVIDGDTFVADIQPWPGISICDDYGHIRLIYRDGSKYDAPEKNTSEGLAARAYAKQLLEDPLVEVGCKGIDSFGRPLCYVTLPDGRDMAAVMAAAGHVKGRAVTENTRKLDRLYEHDERSALYGMSLMWRRTEEAPPPLTSKLWPLDIVLDQGREGACVGFGFSGEAAAGPEKVANVNNTYAHNWYCRAQALDAWSGGSCLGNNSPYYEGTSTLAGAKVGVELGHYTSYLWAQSEDEFARSVGNYGPGVIGVNWYDGMFDPDADGFIYPAGNVAGGHCVVVLGIVLPGSALQKQLGIPDSKIATGVYVIQNSWGADWGKNGRCYLNRENMDRLLHEDGDACLLTRVHIDPDPTPPPPEPKPKKCSWRDKLENWWVYGKYECPDWGAR